MPLPLDAGGATPHAAAASLQVVEHLMPQALDSVGPSVLGGLQPRVLLVSTPNWEYNATMHAAQHAKLVAAAAGMAASSLTGTPKEADEAVVAAATRAQWPGPVGRDGLPLRCADHK